jgi:hypothetical protein
MTQPISQSLFDQRVLEYIEEWITISDYSIPLDLTIPIQRVCDECSVKCIISRKKVVFKYINQSSSSDYSIHQTIDTYSIDSGFHTDYDTDEDEDISHIELRVSYIPDGVRTLICNNYTIHNCILPQSLRVLYCDNILIVPNLPEGLQELHCNGNSDTSLPLLPQSLQLLNCKYSKMKSLPALPPNLIHLDCSLSYISSIPSPLPHTLRYLNCDSSQISSLPPLPPNLEYLNYEYTKIRSYISDLPVSLKKLYCGLNKLTMIGQIPPNLDIFSCKCYDGPLPDFPSTISIIEVPKYTTLYINRLVIEYIENWHITRNGSTPLDFTVLEDQVIHILSTDTYSEYLIETCEFNIPYIPSEVKKLICGRYVKTLPPLPSLLKELDVMYIKSFPDLPDGLESLKVHSITPEQKLPESLRILNCDNSYITSLPPLPPNLEVLSYQNTNILEYITNLPSSLKILRCGGNQLEHIGPFPPNLEHFSCEDYQGPLPQFPPTIKTVNIPKYNMHYVKTATIEYIEKWLDTRNESTTLDLNPLENHIIEMMNSENNPLVYHFEIILPYIPEEVETLICSKRIYQLPHITDTLQTIYMYDITNIPTRINVIRL